MNKRPTLLAIYAIFFMALALSFPIQIAVLYEHGFSEWDLIAQKLSLWNGLCMAFLALSSFLVFNAHPALMWVLPLLMISVLSNNTAVALYGEDFGELMPHVASLVFVATLVPLLSSADVHLALQHPHTRWWLEQKRVQNDLKVALYSRGHQIAETQTFDVSESGLYVKLGSEDLAKLAWDHELSQGHTVSLQVYAEGEGKQPINLRARVARIMTDTSGNYPTGLGLKIRYDDLTQNRRWWNYVGDTIQKIGDNIYPIKKVVPQKISNSSGGSKAA